MKLNRYTIAIVCTLLLGACTPLREDRGALPSSQLGINQAGESSDISTPLPETPITPEEMIKGDLVRQFSDKFKKQSTDVFVTVGKYEDSSALGTVNFAGEQGGASWVAVKDKGGWLLIHDGQSTISCAIANEYGVSKSLIKECISSKGKVVKR